MKVLMINRATVFTVPGGDTVQMVETAKAIRKHGINVDIRLANEEIDYEGYDLIHFFNIIRPNSISRHVKKSRLPFVISTIFVDYTEIDRKLGGVMLRTASQLLGSDRLEYLKVIGRRLLNGEKIVDHSYIFRGHKRSVEQLLNSASLLLPNSNNEFKRLSKRYRFKNEYLKVPNAVSEEFLETIPKNNKSGIVMVARIEALKNQLNLIEAMKGLNTTLKIVGKPAPNHMDYYQKCIELAPSNVEFMGQLDRREVIAQLDAAKVHVLPSWFETTGLSTLEAAARNCNVVITRKGDTQEYFGDKARYCEPGDPESIKSALLKALEDKSELRDYVEEHYTWGKAAQMTIKGYQHVLNQKTGYNLHKNG